MVFSLSSLLLFSALLTAPLQNGDDPHDRPYAMQATRTQGDIQIDGYLDEADWNTAPLATDFLQFDPDEGLPSKQRTEVRVLYGDNDVYIGVKLYDDDPSAILQTLGRRDFLNQADWFFVAIDSYFDRKTAYTFGVNAAGIQIDGIQISGSSFRQDPREFDTSWDAVWYSDVKVTDEGWSAEMRIPYSMLRFPEVETQTWGINFRRFIGRESELSEWKLVRRADYAGGSIAQYGTLEGLHNIRPRRNIQVTPYTVSKLNSHEGDPGQAIWNSNTDFGGDFKVGISTNITLDATVNPDFGQVESDPAVLNLTVFETILQERRPFFVEGSQIFNYNFGFRDALLYTRRIGANAPIIGASKLSGRTDSGFSFGVLGAATGNEFKADRYYGVVRAQQQIGQYSYIGTMATMFDAADLGDNGRTSYTGGLDWDLRFKNNQYKISGQSSFTHRRHPGSDVSPETGISASVGLDKTRGIFTYGVDFEVMDDVFNPNDLGRLRQNDKFRGTLFLSHLLNKGKAFGPFRRGSVRLFNWNEWSYDRSLYTGSGFFFFSSWLTQGFNEIDMQVSTRDIFGGYDQFQTRGLYPRAVPVTITSEFSILSDSRKPFQIGPEIEAEFSSDGGTDLSLGVQTEWNAGTRVSLEGEFAVGMESGTLEWASNEAFRPGLDGWEIGNSGRQSPSSQEGFTVFNDQGQLAALFAPATPFDDDGSYYVPIYGERDTRSIDLTLRSNVTFTKNLSLQLFSQLFVAKGRYNNYQILQNSDNMAAFDAYPKEHDFSLHSFISNVVLRWEFRPGSSLFLVWSQARTNDIFLDPFNPNNISLYETTSFRQIGDTFGLFPDNAILLKLNYLFRN